MKFLVTLLFLASLNFSVNVSSAKHSIVKRKAEDGKLYVYSKLKGCVAVQSRQPCPVNSTLAPHLAKNYEAMNSLVDATLKLYDPLGIGSGCKDDLKAIMCSQSTPECFEDGSQNYGEAKRVCEERVYKSNSCPKVLVDQLKKQKYCETLSTGKQQTTKCVFATEKIAGSCPQPKYKMPSYVLKDYTKRSQTMKPSFDQMTKSGQFSDECMTSLKEMSCEAVYCSEDEEKLLVKYDQEECDKVITLCFNKTLHSVDDQAIAKQLKNILKSSCKFYPTSNSTQLVSAPPISASNHHSAKLSFLLFISLSFVKFMLNTV